MIKVGFTGTRHGMSGEQLKEFENLIKSKEISEFHHGMCVGADKQAHDFIKSSKINIVGHPPIYKKFISNYITKCEQKYHTSGKWDETEHIEPLKKILDYYSFKK